MATEKEYRFLVTDDSWKTLATLEDPIEIKQGYLYASKEKTVRIRSASTNGEGEAFLTVKGEKVGAECPEFETPVDVAFAEELLGSLLCYGLVSKTRSIQVIQTSGALRDHIGALELEIDVFHGHLEGLVIIEVEVPKDVSLEDIWDYLPDVVKSSTNITEDYRYTNSYMGRFGIPK